MHEITISCNAYFKYLHTLLQTKKRDLRLAKQELQRLQEEYDALPWYRRWYHFDPNNPGNSRGLKWKIADLERDIKKIIVFIGLIEVEQSQNSESDYYYITFSSKDSVYQLKEIETMLKYEI